MNYVKPLSIRTSLLAALAGVLSLIPAASVIAQQIPAGDLTVTVEEQENGDVKFSLSGTAYMQSSLPFPQFVTNFSLDSASPPANGDIGDFGDFENGGISLPSGLTLTMPDNPILTSEIESPEECPAQTFIQPLGNFYTYEADRWFLGEFLSGELSYGDPITGAGSVTTSNIPFSLFVPGTFLVGPAEDDWWDSEPEASVIEGEIHSSGLYPYSITYEVIPFVPNPSLSLSHPGAFPKTIRGKSGGTKRVMIKNNGNAPLTGLSLSIDVPGSRDFSTSAIPKTALAPGESTSVAVSFRPKGEGQRTGTLTVKGFYTPRVEFGFVEEGAPEEGKGEYPVVPVEVSASTQLTGQGLPKPRPNRRPNTPRFPFGPR